MLGSIPTRNRSTSDPADPVVAVAPAAAPPAPRAVRILFDDVSPLLSNNLAEAVGAYLECGRAPNFSALSTLRNELLALKDELTFYDEINGTKTADRMFEHAQQTLLVKHTAPQAPQLLLSHLVSIISQYWNCDEQRRQDLMPHLFTTLDRYMNALRERHLQAAEDDHADTEERHEQTRNILFEPERQRIVRRFAQRAAGGDGGLFDVFAHLGITADYRASRQDREEFRALFESGRIVRSKMVYMPPDECCRLYVQYEREVKAAMKYDGIEGDLDDMIAVRTYTISSNELNQALREANLEIIDIFAPYIKTFVSGLANLRTSSSSVYPDADGFVTLLRGVRMSEKELLQAGYVPGVVFRNPTPMSCSDDPEVSYLNMRDHYNVHIKVRCRPPYRTGEVSRHANNENEWIVALQKWIAVKSLRWLPGGTSTHPYVNLVFEQRDDPPSPPASPPR